MTKKTVPSATSPCLPRRFLLLTLSVAAIRMTSVLAFNPISCRLPAYVRHAPSGCSSGCILSRPLCLSAGSSSNNDDTITSIQGEPFFRMQQIPTATTGARLDHVVDCAEGGQCNVEEMLEMIEGT
jgi:hypothetical protein